MDPSGGYTSRALTPADRGDPPLSRSHNRERNQFRPLKLPRAFTENTPGSVLVESGNTKVLCTASINDHVPQWMHGKGGGWLTAEYSMLPGATHTRKFRDGRNNRVDARSLEIQRLIGRSLRAVADLDGLGERTLWVDCDVLQADGGTRTAAITGGYVALALATQQLIKRGDLTQSPIHGQVAAVSVGLYDGTAVLDLDYAEDAEAETDMNIVMNEAGGLIEIQGTAEGHAFLREELDQLLDLAARGIEELLQAQRAVLEG